MRPADDRMLFHESTAWPRHKVIAAKSLQVVITNILSFTSSLVSSVSIDDGRKYAEEAFQW